MTRTPRARDLSPFGQGQRQSGAASWGRTDPSCRCQNRLYRRVVPIKQLGDLLERLTLLPALPHQRLLALRVMDPRSLLHLQHSSDCSGYSVLHPPVESTADSCRWRFALADVPRASAFGMSERPLSTPSRPSIFLKADGQTEGS